MTLASLAGQAGFEEVEVILADGSSDGRLRGVAEANPWVRYLALPEAPMPVVKAAAIAIARGEFVGFVDPVDRARPGWVRAILRGFDDDARVAAIGGEVRLADGAAATDRAAYLFEYGAFEPPLAAGLAAGDLPGNNVAYRRALLAGECAALISRLGFNKPFVHEELRRAGFELVLTPQMSVEHVTRYRLTDFGRRRFHYGRCFGANRAREASSGRAVALRLAAPLIPALLVVRHLGRAIARPWARRTLHRMAAPLAAICLCWGCGEWLGLWAGAGRSAAELR